MYSLCDRHVRIDIVGEVRLILVPYVGETVDEHVLHHVWQGGVKERSVERLNVPHCRLEVLSKKVGCVDRVTDKVAVEVTCMGT